MTNPEDSMAQQELEEPEGIEKPALTYTDYCKKIGKILAIFVLIPCAVLILFHATQNAANNPTICEEISDDGTVINHCYQDRSEASKTTNISDISSTIIIDDDPENIEQKTFNSVSIQSYAKSAMKTFVNSLHDPAKQKQLRSSYNDIMKSVYSRDDQSAIHRSVIKRRKTVTCDIEKMPKAVAILAKGIVDQFNDANQKDREIFEQAIEELVKMAEIAVDSYGDEMKTINLNTQSGQTSTFLAGLLAMKMVSETKVEVGVLMHMETWQLKKGWKINANCRRGDQMCWDSIKIEEALKYQMFHDYMGEIDDQ
eukprot:CAMPEP_0201571942 /NCGR_PEP_ID=MMETSP0190_2-20130828/14952_1 /ASSEMBLY_ACC=CAM_ASM_000263 /TAXON_ID=37353 /ORGANISM="Rosalina sp." /LENGTH=311 /DNA_ID=CAMNT_0047997141 /DNA_START=95 /DNA_END=1030 /DNA_ORIENTATION=-